MYKSIPIVIIIILILGGGLSFASSKASPGGILYPIKINLIEKVERSFSVGLEAKAKTEIKFALRRLQELEKLVSRPKYKIQTRDFLLANFKEHIEKEIILVIAISEKADLKTAMSLHQDFESKLGVHKLVLESIEAPEEVKVAVNAEIQQVVLQRNVFEGIGVESDPQTFESASAKEKLTAEKLTLMREQIKNLGTNLKSEAEITLLRAEDFLSQGRKMLEMKNFEEASSLFQSSSNIIDDLKTILEVGGKLDISLPK